MGLPLFLLSFVFSVEAAPTTSYQNIARGSVATIDRYPFQVALLWSEDLVWYSLSCGGTILNQRSILTATHCFWWHPAPTNHRVRVGSSRANSGGVIHTIHHLVNHPSYDSWTHDNDISVVRLATVISFNSYVQPGAIAAAGYDLPGDQAVWIAGWDLASEDGRASFDQLRHYQLWTIDHEACRTRYEELGLTITDNMVCTGWKDTSNRQCTADSGNPLVHNGVVVGVTSWGYGCDLDIYPGVNTKTSRYIRWIQAHA